MQPRIRRLPLLLLPLLAACAPALASHAAAPAPDRVTARRAGSHAIDVMAAQPAYAHVLELRPDHEEVLQLLNGGEATEVAPGRQRIFLDVAIGETSSRAGDVRYSAYDRRYCAQGERLVFSSSPGPYTGGALPAMRPVNVRGKRRYCMRDFVSPSAPTTINRQALVVVTSAEPIAAEALNEAVASVNLRFAAGRRSIDAIFAIAKDALRERGIQAYLVRVR